MTSIQKYIDSEFDSAIPTICEYIKIPNISPFFDKEWATNGLIDKAMKLLHDWVAEQKIDDLKLTIIQSKDRTPLLVCDIAAVNSEKTILLYGHMDKQPPMDNWSEGLGPYNPVLKDGKLYGRGGADDGYSVFSSILAIKALKNEKISHGRCLILIEASEESGSSDLLFYVDKLRTDKILTNPDLVICLDSGCEDYERLWLTSSLRGLVSGELTIKTLDAPVHSGDGGGIVPNCFDILRVLLDRVHDSKTNYMTSDFEKYVDIDDIPLEHVEKAKELVDLMGEHVVDRFPLTKKIKLDINGDEKLLEYNLKRSWDFNLSVIGIDGIPSCAKGGNAIHPELKVKLSLRLPPHMSSKVASDALKFFMEFDMPCASYTEDSCGEGWVAKTNMKLDNMIAEISENVYGKKHMTLSEGGSIPFIKCLGEMFPDADFVVCGVLGPGSNAHSTDEFLNIPYVKKLTACVSELIGKYSCA